ncbi:MAG: adenylate cyclase [Gammaproteobacteria bacterium]|jgi:adenylate cyclase
MSPGREQRRLSAILAADVAGYTGLIEQDTEGTVAAWRSARTNIIDPATSEHSGRIVKHTGDGFLAEFSTVQDAVKCAIKMQEALSWGTLDFRIGVNLGDVIDDGEDIHGEGVNIASRIEALADPGGISVSGGVYDQVRNRLECSFKDMGEYEVKHVSAPVRIYRVVLETEMAELVAKQPAPLALPDKPSIAVLPFDNMSGDPEQEYFADGITEDITTALSRISDLFVIARNSAFTYKVKGDRCP